MNDEGRFTGRRAHFPSEKVADEVFEHFRSIGRTEARFDPDRNAAVNRIIVENRHRLARDGGGKGRG